MIKLDLVSRTIYKNRIIKNKNIKDIGEHTSRL